MRCVSGQREGKIAGERGSCKGGRAAVEESGARGGYRGRGERIQRDRKMSGIRVHEVKFAKNQL